MDVFIIILIMSAATYIPRLMPMLFFRVDSISPALRRMLSYIPYAALGALIFPGSISAVNGRPGLSAAAVLITAIIAWFNSSIILTVFISVAVTWFMLAAGF